MRTIVLIIVLFTAVAGGGMSEMNAAAIETETTNVAAVEDSIVASATVTTRPPSIGHPAIPLLDRDGINVLTSQRPVSTMRTCDGCHDTGFIARRNYHATVGLDEWKHPGSEPGWRPWDMSPGEFGRWNPLLYRRLSAKGDSRLDLGTADWIRLFGARHTGGGPALTSREGTPVANRDNKSHDPETAVLDATTGAATAWNWDESGSAELNCFICHLAAPDNGARAHALRTGRFEWAAMATLTNTSLVSATDDDWRWEQTAFENDQTVTAGQLPVIPPSSKQCGACHGLVHAGDEPIIPSYQSLANWRTETTGQIFSAQNLFDSGMNIASKSAQGRPWDIHAERLLKCAHCHFAINDPAYATEESVSRPQHLAFDSRRLEIGEFLHRPNHNFAKGHSAQSTVANSLDGTMRRCGDCHDALVTHNWLPYKQRHMERLLCESCHVPAVNAPARRLTDWTILTPTAEPRIEYRGVRGPIDDPASLIEGYTPVLLPRVDRDGESPRLGPHNLVTTWYWIYDGGGGSNNNDGATDDGGNSAGTDSENPPRPVRLFDLKKALFDGGRYHADIIEPCDLNRDGKLTGPELILDTPQKVAAVRDRLAGLGLINPRITAEIQPYGLHHGVVTKQWARRQCMSCHSETSAITRPIVLTAAAPAAGTVLPALVGDTNVRMTGSIANEGDGLVYKPATLADGYYVLGHDRWQAVDIGGIVLILGTLIGAVSHGGFRWYHARRRRGS